ncbi:hypothetical protein [Brumimicrobium oceani]|uniref:Uncharacterized protein n=1 Tax=Brumimicrobium oceani TaxID=2100725 RepID=A0A2U2X0S3_9FLAO|nr:hypothetical protein [Brumimicrobium oceani]PWH81382.1 hypothetical protein DIT68_15250 [Brumimicrobium oceani]
MKDFHRDSRRVLTERAGKRKRKKGRITRRYADKKREKNYAEMRGGAEIRKEKKEKKGMRKRRWYLKDFHKVSRRVFTERAGKRKRKKGRITRRYADKKREKNYAEMRRGAEIRREKQKEKKVCRSAEALKRFSQIRGRKKRELRGDAKKSARKKRER